MLLQALKPKGHMLVSPAHPHMHMHMHPHLNIKT